MKILFDECVPYALMKLLRKKLVVNTFSVRMMGWSSIKNGDLIKLANEEFDVFVTIDKNLKYQQNLNHVKMAIVLLSVIDNKVVTVLKKADELILLLNSIDVGKFYEI